MLPSTRSSVCLSVFGEQRRKAGFFAERAAQVVLRFELLLVPFVDIVRVPRLVLLVGRRHVRLRRRNSVERRVCEGCTARPKKMGWHATKFALQAGRHVKNLCEPRLSFRPVDPSSLTRAPPRPASSCRDPDTPASRISLPPPARAASCSFCRPRHSSTQYLADMATSDRPRVFLDVDVDGKPAGRLVFELFSDQAPKTCENFRQLCAAEHHGMSYAKSPFHRVIDEFMVQGGDIANGDGTGVASIYGGEFEDENLEWRDMDAAGLLCSANRGRDTNG
ncbi:hypothetical protein EPUL_005642, partial [Erysiphe pulchra]